MTRNKLLQDLKELCEEATSDMVLPTIVTKGDEEFTERAPDVYKMRLPNSRDAKKYAPYIIVQYVNGVDKQKSTMQSTPQGTAVVRFIFCVYCRDEQEGSMMLLNVMDRVRMKLLKKVVAGSQFKLDTTEEGLESLVYTDDTSPFFAGEMIGTFIMPSIEREPEKEAYLYGY